MSKRKIEINDSITQTPQLLFISVAEEPYFYCYATPLTKTWTEDLITKLSMSSPTLRKGVIPGCDGDDGYFSRDIWRKVEESEVKDMTNIGRVVLGFYYE